LIQPFQYSGIDSIIIAEICKKLLEHYDVLGKNKATSFFQGSHDYHILFYTVFGNAPGSGKRDARGNGSAIRKKFISGIYLALYCRFRHPRFGFDVL
jgi:hypothetical protein